MKKLKLDLDDLEVESFQTTPEAGDSEEGTVYGYLSFGPGNTCDDGCTNNTFCRVCTQLGCTAQTNCNQNTCPAGCTDQTNCNQNTCVGCTAQTNCNQYTCAAGCQCITQPAVCGTFACTLPASC
ncbi:MAG: hypothetical protein AAF657_26240 [Acidobacteriota bacterium]